MSIELPFLRLGLAGFTAEQQERVARLIQQASPGHVGWQLSPFGEADAWWLHGARSTMVAEGVMRVAPGSPTSRSLQINLAEVDRPMAFALPVAPAFERACAFDLAQPGQARSVLEKFSAWLQPVVAQYGLAACLVDHYSALGPGVFDVILDNRLIAVVDMRGQIAVLPTAGPTDFADAMWRRRSSAQAPEHFLKTSVSQLMWQYAVRTSRDLLPAHYRTGLLYYRRPPHLSQRLMKDAHLLLLRELAMAPGTFEQLEQRTGLVGQQLSRPLAALYYVGAITANPKRAAAHTLRRGDARDSAQTTSSGVMPSLLDSKPIPVPVRSDLTAPAPLMR